MLELIVPDMTCDHCMKTITRAIGEMDSTAKLDFDMPRRRVRVTSAASADEVRSAIERVGYTVSDAVTERPTEAASCCGSCHR